MGRHTAPIPIVSASRPSQRSGPVTDPKLLDQRRLPEHADARMAPASPRLPVPVPAGFRPEADDDGIDERSVDVEPRSAKSVVNAQPNVSATAATPHSRPARVLELAFATAAICALAVAVTVALLR